MGLFMTDVVVSKLEKARLLLFQAKNASDAKRVMDMAHAAEIYAKRQKMSDEAIGHAHSIKIEATRQLGEPTCCEIYSNKGHTNLREASRETIRDWCKNWANKADKNQL